MYDLIIIGAGPAGLTAAIYAARYKLKHLVIGDTIGGQVVEAVKIENWPGIEVISGKDLMDSFYEHAKKSGSNFLENSIKGIKKTEEGFFEIYTEKQEERNNTFQSKSIIFALGMKPRQMNIPGEKEFIGRGVSYCATCEEKMFNKKDTVVIGGGDSAAVTALHLSDFSNRIYVVCLEEGKCFKPSLEEEMKKKGNIEIIICSKVLAIEGDENVIKRLVYEKEGEEKNVQIEAVAIEIGTVPGVAIAKSVGVKLNEKNYILVNPDQSTNIDNIYAAGDVTTSSNGLRQIVTASSEGAIAASSIYRKLNLTKK